MTCLRYTARAVYGVMLGLALLLFAGTMKADAATITTVDTGNRAIGTRATLYFDLVVGDNDIVITGMEANFLTGSMSGFTVYTGLGPRAGNETDDTFWTLAATGTGSAVGFSLQPVTLDRTIFLSANTTYAFALVEPSATRHLYTFSSSGTPPLTYSNDDLTLNFGAISEQPFTASPFTGTVFENIVWNGSITYDVVSAVPLPAAVWLFLSALGGLGLFGWRKGRAAV